MRIKNYHKKIVTKIFSILVMLALVFGSVPAPAYAALYSPGETLNPACAPTDANCGVISAVTATGNAINLELGPTATTTGGTAELKFLELTANGTNYVALKAPDSLNTNVLFMLPSADGTLGQLLSSNGAGALSWTTSAPSQWTTAGSNIYYNTGNIGIGTATPNQQLEITGNFRLPTSTATAGIVYSGANRFIHNYGTNNFFAGANAGNLTMTGTGTNTVVGSSAFSNNTTGSSNSAFGYNTLNLNTTGASNTAVGNSALAGNIAASNNTAVGSGALMINTLDTGNDNTAVGVGALALSAGSKNTAIGYNAGMNNTSGISGSNNSFFGYKAGDNVTTGSNNLVVGYDIDAPSATASNQLSIGNLIFGTGLDATGTAIATGNIGIGTATPGAKLHIAPSTAAALQIDAYGASAGNTSEIRFQELTANGTNYTGFKSPDSLAANVLYTLPNADGTSGQVLSSNGAGALSWLSTLTSINGFAQNGNSFGGLATLGTNDNNGLAFETNSVERLRIDASGNVGIGTNTPTAKLEISPSGTAGVTWATKTAPTISYKSVAFGNGTYVAVADTNLVATSPDGSTWTQRSIPTASIWRDVTYANGLFVAVGSVSGVGTVMTSPDGIIWTNRTPSANNNWQSIAYGNNIFVAVASSGTGNRVMTSPDGITWTSRTSASDDLWYGVTYGNNLFVAVSFLGSTFLVMTSPDGITWTGRTASNSPWNSVAYGGGLFVAVSEGAGVSVMTSPDGITWTDRTAAATNFWRGVTYGNGIFVAVASSGTGNRVMTSPDGITWTSRTTPEDNNWNGITFGNNLFVAVADSGTNRIMTSSGALPTAILANGGISVAGSVVPTSNIAYDLGSATNRFRSLYLSGTTLYIGDQSLSNSSGSLTWSGTSIQATPNATSATDIKLSELSGNGSNYTGFKSPDALAANVLYTLPNADGATGQSLTTNGSGGLSWASSAGVSVGKTSTVHHSVGTALAITTAHNNAEIHAESTGGFTIDGASFTEDTFGATIVNTGGVSVTLTPSNFVGAFLRDGTADGGFTTLTIGQDEAYSLTVTDNAGAKFLNVVKLGGGTANAFAQNGNAFGALATLGTTDNNALRFIASSTEAMRILANGKVGIGTPTPSSKLTVLGDLDVRTVVAAAPQNPNLNSGNGVVTTVGADTIITYTTTGASTFTPPTGVASVQVLVVAGGAGGGYQQGGGGGAGGLKTNASFAVTAGTPITVTVGAGGAGGTSSGAAGNGTASVFSTITTTGGGAGGNVNSAGSTGGSGGGSGAGSTTIGTGTSGEGNNGGSGLGAAPSGGGGGGGASAVGTAKTASPDDATNAAGGAGTASTITGTSVTYAGGGGGGKYGLVSGSTVAAAGGAGGGGTGGLAGAGTAGVANTGGGGGGGGQTASLFPGGAGGSGVVIVRFVTVGATTTVTSKLAVDASGNTTVGGNLTIGNLSGLLVANAGAVSNFATSTATTGQVLGIQSGALAWVNQSIGGSATTTINGASGPAFTFNAGAGLAISTSTNSLTFTPNYAGATTDGIVSTSTQTFAGAKTFSGALNASSTLAVTGNSTLYGTLAVNGTATLATTTVSKLTLTGLTGLVSADTNGVLSGIATSTLGIALSDTTGILAASRGGTGFVATTTANRLLLTNASGGYDLVATSSLGISGGSSQWTTATNDIYYNTGNVAIGTGTPSASARLLVYGTAGNTENLGLVYTGGTILGTAIDGTDTVIRYNGSGTFTPPTGVTNVRVLVVAGGGGGGVGVGGGGGAGGVIASSSVPVSGSVTVIIGAGGAGRSSDGSGFNGSSSVFGLISTTGGGGGAGWNMAAGTGGSGGGGNSGNATFTAGGTGITGQGFAGGTGGATLINGMVGAGGGGAGALGANGGTVEANGVGGVGISNNITGTSTFYGGGGGGGLYTTGAVLGVRLGGNGGGGTGNSTTAAATAGAANTGGGGGGSQGFASAAGGSGVVIVRFTTVGVATSSQALFKVTNAGTDTNSVLAFFETGASQSCIIAGQTGLSCSSDKNLKKDIEATDGVLGNVLALKPVTYNWRATEELGADGFDPYAVAEGVTGDNVGFIAQDVEKIFPGLVRFDPNGNRTLAYDKFAPLIIAALQEQYGGLLGVNVASVSPDMLFATAESLIDDSPKSEILNPKSETNPNDQNSNDQNEGIVGYLKEKVTGGIKIVRELVTERMVAVSGYFKRIFANELCLTDANGQLVCVTGENLKQIGGQTRALTPVETASVSEQTAPAILEASIVETEVAPAEEQAMMDTITDLSAAVLAEGGSIAPEEATPEETITTSESVVETAPVAEAPILSEPIVTPLSEEPVIADAPNSNEPAPVVEPQGFTTGQAPEPVVEYLEAEPPQKDQPQEPVPTIAEE